MGELCQTTKLSFPVETEGKEQTISNNQEQVQQGIFNYIQHRYRQGFVDY